MELLSIMRYDVLATECTFHNEAEGVLSHTPYQTQFDFFYGSCDGDSGLVMVAWSCRNPTLCWVWHARRRPQWQYTEHSPHVGCVRQQHRRRERPEVYSPTAETISMNQCGNSVAWWGTPWVPWKNGRHVSHRSFRERLLYWLLHGKGECSQEGQGLV